VGHGEVSGWGALGGRRYGQEWLKPPESCRVKGLLI
jgi:hypothetical protein